METLEDMMFTWRPSNHVVTRQRGDIPGCIPAPHDKSLLELNDICDEDTSELHLKVLRLYSAGQYTGMAGWDRAMKELDLLRKRGTFAEAMRRDIRARYVVVPNKNGKSKIKL